MLRLASYDVVFAEVPGEVTLALNISGCPNGCPGCHSTHLQEDIGEMLDDALMEELLADYGQAVTCVCFMGGDADPHQVERLAGSVRLRSRPAGRLKTAWYSGRKTLPEGIRTESFDYIKLGPYLQRSGGLGSPTTNQRFYKVSGGEMTDITEVFRA